MLSGSLPIYWGPPEAADFIPGGQESFINILDFENEESLLNYLEYLDQNDEAYLEYFKWREKPFANHFLQMFRYSMKNNGATSYACRMCVTFAKEFCGILI